MLTSDAVANKYETDVGKPFLVVAAEAVSNVIDTVVDQPSLGDDKDTFMSMEGVAATDQSSALICNDGLEAIKKAPVQKITTDVTALLDDKASTSIMEEPSSVVVAEEESKTEVTEVKIKGIVLVTKGKDEAQCTVQKRATEYVAMVSFPPLTCSTIDLCTVSAHIRYRKARRILRCFTVLFKHQYCDETGFLLHLTKRSAQLAV